MEKKQPLKTSSKYLTIPMRTFMDGMASLLDLSGSYYFQLHHHLPMGKQMKSDSDADAIRSDWEKVGLDIYKCAYQYGEK